MKKTTYLVAIAVLTCAAWLCSQTIIRAQQEGNRVEPKHTIKEVMTQAHKEGLMKKVAGGEASADEEMQLLDLYLSLLENDPPKGENDSWMVKSGIAALAAARVVVGRDGAEDQLTKAVNCANCHKAHKPPAN